MNLEVREKLIIAEYAKMLTHALGEVAVKNAAVTTLLEAISENEKTIAAKDAEIAALKPADPAPG